MGQVFGALLSPVVEITQLLVDTARETSKGACSNAGMVSHTQVHTMVD
jgi:hypothetical protein